MAVTAFPAESPDLALLNVARLFTRLEHNLLSPGTDRRTLQQSEYQRMRVNKNVEYARTLLTQLERSLPQLKPLDRKHEAQAEIARDRQLLKRIQTILDEEDAKAAAVQDDDDNDDTDGDDEWKELFSKPVAQTKVHTPASQTEPKDRDMSASRETKEAHSDQSATTTQIPSTTQSEPTPTPSANTPAPPTLRNRHARKPLVATDKATATGSNTKQHDTENELSTHRMEQEDLTGSLLTLAAQLKTSSISFQSALEGEKSALDRAVSGIDRTSTTMEAAGKRMGMLRKMTEGKGLWGRMMLYAWIFGLWVVAILIVYVGPKLRF
ncbi:unnamed protein product [Penicillium olsonii]|uniref:Synaptobrevin n=1 Tax=Penicillium olsonii TaxID=99116 RepID=A0A9W4HFL8_PENOL|nr:unnamed protein product [Penicillium olsonii]CAG8147591.1 unnamed protein product [Penicillium olsonii]